MEVAAAAEAEAAAATAVATGGGNSGGGSSGGSSSGGGSSATECRSGKVWDKKSQKCVAPKQGLLDDDSLYEAGRGLAMAGRYGEAITVLGYVANKADPRVLNYLGYSHRKAGRIQVGLGYYQEALRINPDYVLAREYLGEAYLTLGDLASAQGPARRDPQALRQGLQGIFAAVPGTRQIRENLTATQRRRNRCRRKARLEACGRSEHAKSAPPPTLTWLGAPPYIAACSGALRPGGRLAQRESTPFTRVGSQVQSLHRPPIIQNKFS